MRLPLRLSAKGLELSEDEQALLRAAADKLTTFFDRVMGCRVTVSTPNRRPQSPETRPLTYTVRIDLTVPGDELVVRRQAEPELETAIQEAFRAAGRRLQDYAVRLGSAQPPEARTEPARGKVLRIMSWEGYGFLEAADGHEVYFHRNSVLHGGFERLEPGTEIRFSEEEGREGPQASTVEIARARKAGRGISRSRRR